jgi:hypothetical protein
MPVGTPLGPTSPVTPAGHFTRPHAPCRIALSAVASCTSAGGTPTSTSSRTHALAIGHLRLEAGLEDTLGQITGQAARAHQFDPLSAGLLDKLLGQLAFRQRPRGRQTKTVSPSPTTQESSQSQWLSFPAEQTALPVRPAQFHRSTDTLSPRTAGLTLRSLHPLSEPVAQHGWVKEAHHDGST